MVEDYYTIKNDDDKIQLFVNIYRLKQKFSISGVLSLLIDNYLIFGMPYRIYHYFTPIHTILFLYFIKSEKMLSLRNVKYV